MEKLTVRELIAKLKKFNPDAQIVVPIKTFTQVYPAHYGDVFMVEQFGDHVVRLYTTLADNQHVVTRKAK